MIAMSDFNGFDIKVHGNDTQRLFDCLTRGLAKL